MDYPDKMTPAQRAAAKAKGEPADRVACNPNIGNGMARIAGYKISQFNDDPEALADAIIKTYRRFGADGARIFTDLFLVSEAMGAKVRKPEDNTADLEEPAINDMSEFDKLKVIDPYTQGRIPVHLRAIEIVRDEIASEVGVTASVVGPFTNAFFLIGVEKMTKMLLKDPESVHKLCEISLQSCIALTDAVLEKGVGVTISEPLSSCTVVSPKHFREFSAPYLKRLIDHIKARTGKLVIHICGITDPIWDDLVEMGVDVLSIDNVADMEKCAETVGDKMVIAGNVDPSAIMYAGSREDVRKATIKCAKQGLKAKKGFMIMSGCSLPVEVPIENIDAMMDTAREMGWPVTEEKLDHLLSFDKYKD
ncbi:uroporphyrinogen decarboxylase family protein [Methanococcus maripaludis]|jgi:uroporphyrinogen decarboxylase|uniref:Putative uroporphyrinogen decarboxylase n=2 Tax=Methanococcus maripaludis TaxID=39152 RepID=A0A2Z5PH92_METMI|nr:uroporphyrinogen decarboxylase family protein [Methanococcus maripaludis]BAP61033.1 putative uroporphyrinogen decarboxylase [Methanococcus maripaludis KA1]BAP62980.1 putative uroporphyrinogen decarboxylase [Methanococcus maripaludis OS7]